MTLVDWLKDSAYRFKTQSPHEAAYRSAYAFARGANRRFEPDLIPSVWERSDWDVLVILDACRVDLMESVIGEYDNLPDDVDSVWSQAACSIDWIETTFNENPEELPNTAYISANPFTDHDAAHAQSADLSAPPLGHLRKLYQTDWYEIGGIETVPPEWVTNHAIDCWRQRDDLDIDRMVVHYMQPHEPYITRPGWSQLHEDDNPVLKNLVEDGYTAGTSPWQTMVEDGPVSVGEFWPVYQDNLRWVLNDVCGRLLENINGRVAISADHGNGLGEYGEWHHPPGAISPYVRKVPWLEVAATDQRTISPQITRDRDPDPGTQTQLRALGYQH